jgi:TolA-binding protein
LFGLSRLFGGAKTNQMNQITDKQNKPDKLDEPDRPGLLGVNGCACSRSSLARCCECVACLLLVVFPGCASLTHRFPAFLPHAVSTVDPALDAQTLLIESAYLAYLQERYPLASASFQRFVDSYSDSPRLSEAR